MKMKNKIVCLLLALCLVLSLCACSGNGEAGSPTPESVQPAEDITASPGEIPSEGSAASENGIDAELPINIMVLNGTTGFGAAKMIDDVKNSEAALNYDISVETDASNVTAALINGSVDIAALPTNAASTVYNKTNGEVQLLALSNLGVLYVVCDGERVQIESFEDLRGMTVYCPAQNPTFIFSYLCEQNGLVPGEDIIIDNTYAQPADLRTALAAGEIEIAVLPEPLITAATAANDKLYVVLDLTVEWDAVSKEGSLVQSCVVVRRAFAEEHPEEVAQFLADYEASIAFLSDDTAAAAEMIVAAGIFTSAPVAEKAIPKCNLCFIAGEEMRNAMSEFLSIMFEVAPASIGGAIPGDDFYYIP